MFAKVAKAMDQAVRSTDLIARYGGEEFVVVLPKINGEIAVKVADRIRAQIKTLQMPHAKSKVAQYVTLSCGVASTIPNAESSPAALIASADEGLYRAKEEGLDRIILLK
ncbi:MAG: diguanylate cyclase [Moorea sp. SIO2B7]|nr:diguanylate cyclase [Moorena sp. SIO2B7]